MGQLSYTAVLTWYENSSQEITNIFNKEGGTNAFPRLANRITKPGAIVIYMVDQADKSTIREAYFTMVSHEEISKQTTQIAEDHLVELMGKKFIYPYYELLLQIDKNGKIVDYTKRRVPQTPDLA
jgi:hypothetical protein